MSDAQVQFESEEGEDTPGKEVYFSFKCPKRRHLCGNLALRGRTGLKEDPQGLNDGIPTWNWDGNRTTPTFEPSINCEGCWHGYIRAGRCVDTGGHDEPEGPRIQSAKPVSTTHRSDDHHPASSEERFTLTLPEGNSMAKIIPTVGRIMWYGGDPYFNSGEPLAAIVVAVVAAGQLVNLAVFDAEGSLHGRKGVLVVQEGEKPPEGSFACWMPFQIGQAAKTEQLAAKISAQNSAGQAGGLTGTDQPKDADQGDTNQVGQSSDGQSSGTPGV